MTMSHRLAIVVVAPLALALLVAPPVAAQTISPLVAEYRGDARGRVELVNRGDVPLTVVLQVHGFTVDEAGTVHDAPLLDGLRVNLSASSLRIPPRQTRFVFYDASSDQRPGWFVIHALFSGYPRADFSGIDVQVELPHFVYVLAPERWKAGDIRVREAGFDRDRGTVALIVENSGPQFGRVESIDVRGERLRVSAPGFPLFPHGRRRIEVPWAGAEPPREVALKSRDVSFDTPWPPGAP
jgi:hypothetical protein